MIPILCISVCGVQAKVLARVLASVLMQHTDTYDSFENGRSHDPSALANQTSSLLIALKPDEHWSTMEYDAHRSRVHKNEKAQQKFILKVSFLLHFSGSLSFSTSLRRSRPLLSKEVSRINEISMLLTAREPSERMAFGRDSRSDSPFLE